MTLQGTLRFSDSIREPLVEGIQSISGDNAAAGALQQIAIPREIRAFLKDYGVEGQRIRVTVELTDA